MRGANETPRGNPRPSGEKVSYFVRVEQLRLSFWQTSLGLKSLSENTEIKHANKNKIKARKP
jgi:hypothetical protein